MEKRPAPSSKIESRPIQPGSIIGKIPAEHVKGAALTPMERQLIEQMDGSVENPPDLTATTIGKELTDKFNEINAAETLDKDATPVSPDTPPLVIPQAIDIKDLSPAKQAEISAAIRQAQMEQAAVKQREVPDTISHIPGAADTFAAAAQSRPIIVDDLDDIEEAPAPKETEPVKTAEDNADEIAPVLCPRCNHQVDQPVIDISVDDKYTFIAATLGGQRFFKEYKFFGDNLRVLFRELTPNEADLALKQLDHETSQGKIVGRYDYLRKLTDYRLIMSIEEFQRKDAEAIKLEEVLKLEKKDAAPTILPQLMTWMNDSIFMTDHIRRIIGSHFMQFQRLMELLEARATDHDFFTMTEEPRF